MTMTGLHVAAIILLVASRYTRGASGSEASGGDYTGGEDTCLSNDQEEACECNELLPKLKRFCFIQNVPEGVNGSCALKHILSLGESCESRKSCTGIFTTTAIRERVCQQNGSLSEHWPKCESSKSLIIALSVTIPVSILALTALVIYCHRSKKNKVGITNEDPDDTSKEGMTRSGEGSGNTSMEDMTKSGEGSGNTSKEDMAKSGEGSGNTSMENMTKSGERSGNTSIEDMTKSGEGSGNTSIEDMTKSGQGSPSDVILDCLDGKEDKADGAFNDGRINRRD